MTLVPSVIEFARRFAAFVPVLVAALVVLPAPARAEDPGWEAAFGNGTEPAGGSVLAVTGAWEDGQLVVYAGGEFVRAGGHTPQRVARWAGSGWEPLGAGLDARVNALAMFDDGTGLALYAGGIFQSSGGTPLAHVARWNGAAWVPVGSGLDDEVLCLTVYDDGTGAALYAGGRFTQAGATMAHRVGRWDGAAWSGLGLGVDGPVGALAVADLGEGPALYAGGAFSEAGGSSVQNVAEWRDGAWSPLGAGLEGGPVVALAGLDLDRGPALIALGQFTESDGQPISQLARWDGTSWVEHDGGAWGDGLVGALLPLTDGAMPAFLAGGAFEFGLNYDASGIARWSEAGWEQVLANGTAEAGSLACVTSDEATTILFGGSGGGATGIRVGTIGDDGIGRLVGGPHRVVKSIASFDDGSGSGARLFVAGGFDDVGDGIRDRKVVRLDPGGWTGLENPFDGRVNVLAVHDDGDGAALFAGGSSSQGLSNHARLARWEGDGWATIPVPFEGRVFSLVTFDDGSGPALYAGGRFLRDGLPPSGVVRWCNGAWEYHFGVSDAAVVALAVHHDGTGTGLYAAGEFDEIGGVAAKRIARFDGRSWTPLGEGITGQPMALASFRGDLIVGGQFRIAGTIHAPRIAAWDGLAWRDLNGGIDSLYSSSVLALEVVDRAEGPELFVAGGFVHAGGLPSRGIARWNGQTWSALGVGVHNTVDALQVHDDGTGRSLIVGGTFQDSPANDAYLARWRLESAPSPCPADLTGDGMIGFPDLLEVLGYWGACADCPQDIDGDGLVGLPELLQVLAAWGPCPEG